MKGALLAALAIAAGGCSKPADRPIRNVLLISIDTLRRDHLGLYGYDRPTSPFLDRLAQGAVVFDQAIAQAPWTAPSHAAMLASLPPSVLGMGDFARPGRIGDAAEMLAEKLKAAGCATHAVVAGGFLAAAIGFDRGFDGYDERGTNMKIVADKATAWLDQRDPSRPFFLFLHTYDVHKYNPPEPYRSAFVREYRGPLREFPPTRIAEMLQTNESPKAIREATPADRRYAMDLYDGAIASVDAELARLHAYLESHDLLDTTLIVITADHGEEFWEHGRSGHGYSLFDENLRVPLLLAHPSLAPRRCASQVRLIDLPPTIADLVHAAPGASWQGESLRPLLDGATQSRLAFSESAHLPFKSVRTPREKFIVSLRRPKLLFFDLQADPGELENRFAADGDSMKSASAALRAWIVANAADDRYRGGEADLGAERQAELNGLGYGSGATAAPVDAAPWLAALEGR